MLTGALPNASPWPYPDGVDALRVFGKFLIAAGVGVLLFVLWTLKGTDLYTDRQQARLEDEFARLPAIQAAGGSSERPLPPEDFAPDHGDPIFKIVIPEIEVEEVVVEGVDRDALKMGPGHYPECGPDFPKPWCLPEAFYPGEDGMTIVSGHRTTYGAPFWALNELKEGDEIRIEARWGNFTYEVTGSEIVADDAVVPTGIGEPEILLTTCNPRFSAEERLLVRGRLVEGTST